MGAWKWGVLSQWLAPLASYSNNEEYPCYLWFIGVSLQWLTPSATHSCNKEYPPCYLWFTADSACTLSLVLNTRESHHSGPVVYHQYLRTSVTHTPCSVFTKEYPPRYLWFAAGNIFTLSSLVLNISLLNYDATLVLVLDLATSASTGIKGKDKTKGREDPQKAQMKHRLRSGSDGVYEPFPPDPGYSNDIVVMVMVVEIELHAEAGWHRFQNTITPIWEEEYSEILNQCVTGLALIIQKSSESFHLFISPLTGAQMNTDSDPELPQRSTWNNQDGLDLHQVAHNTQWHSDATSGVCTGDPYYGLSPINQVVLDDMQTLIAISPSAYPPHIMTTIEATIQQIQQVMNDPHWVPNRVEGLRVDVLRSKFSMNLDNDEFHGLMCKLLGQVSLMFFTHVQTSIKHFMTPTSFHHHPS
ncbi:hypothetical protein V8E55_007184 [Tylopilus felleus]